MEVIIPIGISGSGKSRLYKMRYSDLTLVSPELICKEMYGRINEYSKLNEVREEVSKRVDKLVESGESFYYDGYTIDSNRRKEFTDMFKGKNDIKVTYIILPSDINISLKRIEEDIKNNVERADVKEIILKFQLNLYKQSIESGFKDENVQEIIYLKPEDLN